MPSKKSADSPSLANGVGSAAHAAAAVKNTGSARSARGTHRNYADPQQASRMDAAPFSRIRSPKLAPPKGAKQRPTPMQRQCRAAVYNAYRQTQKPTELVDYVNKKCNPFEADAAADGPRGGGKSAKGQDEPQKTMKWPMGADDFGKDYKQFIFGNAGWPHTSSFPIGYDPKATTNDPDYNNFKQYVYNVRRCVSNKLKADQDWAAKLTMCDSPDPEVVQSVLLQHPLPPRDNPVQQAGGKKMKAPGSSSKGRRKEQQQPSSSTRQKALRIR